MAYNNSIKCPNCSHTKFHRHVKVLDPSRMFETKRKHLERLGQWYCSSCGEEVEPEELFKELRK